MKIYISYDMEGVAGIVDWDQCRPSGGRSYEIGCQLLLAEVNAAIDGAVAGGATEIVANDSHGAMFNLDPAQLHGRAQSITGKHKPMYMMQGLDETFDGVFFVGYHGSIDGRPSVLSHTYNPNVIAGVTVNGLPAGESGVNALVAQHFGVPIALTTGDQATMDEIAPFSPGGVEAVVKESITRFSGVSVHPEQARETIHAAAREAVIALSENRIAAPALESPVQVRVAMHHADMAEIATWAKGVERDGVRGALIEGTDLAAVYRSFVALTYITRLNEGR